ncbi:MAG: hypothetical protein N2255_07565, partial [Kiritimatiellae bacterium]|nr:hypothetical protein [Kiritimatiellia bacterium]
SLWLTYWFTWRLGRRFTRDEFVACLAALPAIVLPYRWMSLCGGSPTGMTMVWLPLLFLGLDVAGRDQRVGGGIVGALALTLAFFNDRQVFLFGMLSVPVWYLLGFLRRDKIPIRERRFWLKTVWAAGPLVLTVAAHAFLAFSAKRGFQGTNLEKGRTIQEVKLFSPDPSGLITSDQSGTNAQVYLGWAAVILLLFHVFLTVDAIYRSRNNRRQTVAPALLLWVQIGVTVILALGPKGPFRGWLFMAAREFVPGFKMLRQSAKVFSLMPTLLAVTAGCTMSRLADLYPQRLFQRMAPLFLATIMLFDYGRRVSITICLLDSSQGSYATVAADASRAGGIPRVLVLPIWPGDSAWASLYQHYVSLYRIRMLNGYRPVVSAEYRKNVFQALNSANTGLLTREQIEFLRKKNVSHVIFHDNAFPEQVSPFPAFFTLKRLLEHPCLELLDHADGIWAFRILDTDKPRSPLDLPVAIWFPAFHKQWEMERLEGQAAVEMDVTASAGRCVKLAAEGTFIAGKSFDTFAVPHAKLKVRVRGRGTFEVRFFETEAGPRLHQEVNTDQWIWLDFPVEAAQQRICPQFFWNAGSVCFDMMLFTAGDWEPPAVGQRVNIPACLFFRAGVVDPQTGTVTLRPEWDADLVIFYGLRLPLERGEYELALVYETTAPAGTLLGEFGVETVRDSSGNTPVWAGERARVHFRQGENVPVSVKFRYSRNAEITIREVQITRTDG